MQRLAEPERYSENSVAEGIALTGALQKAGVLRFALSSTCATYGELEQSPITETGRQRPEDPYGWSKLMFKQILATYDQAYGMKFVALRYFNAAGATATRGEHHEPESHLIWLRRM